MNTVTLSRRGAARPRVPAAIHGEVDKVLAVRRQVAAPLVDAAVEPLTHLEAVGRPVPADHCGVAAWASADDDRRRCVARQKNVETGGMGSGHGLKGCAPAWPRKSSIF